MNWMAWSACFFVATSFISNSHLSTNPEISFPPHFRVQFNASRSWGRVGKINPLFRQKRMYWKVAGTSNTQKMIAAPTGKTSKKLNKQRATVDRIGQNPLNPYLSLYHCYYILGVVRFRVDTTIILLNFLEI